VKAYRETARYAAWIATLLGGLPLFAWQAYRLRRDTPRLAEAAGPCRGVIGGGQPALRLVTIGESTVAGVGAAAHAEALTGCTAASLHRLTGRTVHWHALGCNGARACEVRRTFVPDIHPQADLVVVALGVNDVLSGCTPAAWRTDLHTLLRAVQQRAPGAVIVVSAVPPMGYFPAIPRPLRSLLGWRAAALDRIASQVAAQCPATVHVPIPFAGGNQYFCDDCFHPSPLGYARWGTLVGEAAAMRLAGHLPGTEHRVK
jgi:lysophospholipase L1-like esterase